MRLKFLRKVQYRRACEIGACPWLASRIHQKMAQAACIPANDAVKVQL